MTMNTAAADLDDDYSDTKSIDSCEEYIHFESIRNPSTQLEESISFSWPGIYYCDDEPDAVDGSVDAGAGVGGADAASSLLKNKSVNDDALYGSQGKLRKIILSTLLEEDDIAPIFDGARWAGTRLWRAAIRSIQYLAGHLPDTNVPPDIRLLRTIPNNSIANSNESVTNNNAVSILELGCGLGVPGMIFHLLGCNVVLTDQEDILSQLEKNVMNNFPNSSLSSSINSSSDQSTCCDKVHDTTAATTIQALPLSWSREDVHTLLEQAGRSNIGFDIVVNCDCVFEPLYGKRLVCLVCAHYMFVRSSLSPPQQHYSRNFLLLCIQVGIY